MAKQALTATYRVYGLNLDSFLSGLCRRNITVTDAEKEEYSLKLTISLSDNVKFFAYLKKMCYNVMSERKKLTYKPKRGERICVRIGNGGWALPIKLMKDNIGIIIGIILFLSAICYCQRYIFSVEINGADAEVGWEIKSELEQSGIGAIADKSKLDFNNLAANLLNSNSKLSFVTVRDEGNRLIIDCLVSHTAKRLMYGRAEKLVSDCCGRLIKLNIYRGTAIAEIGSEVEEGTLIADGYFTVGEEKIPTYVVCDAVIECEKTNVVEVVDFSDETFQAQTALILSSYYGEDVKGTLIKKSDMGEKKYLEITVIYHRYLSA